MKPEEKQSFFRGCYVVVGVALICFLALGYILRLKGYL